MTKNGMDCVRSNIWKQSDHWSGDNKWHYRVCAYGIILNGAARTWEEALQAVNEAIETFKYLRLRTVKAVILPWP